MVNQQTQSVLLDAMALQQRRMSSSLTTGSVVARCGDIVAVAEILSRRVNMPGAAMPTQMQQSHPAIDSERNA